MLRPTHPGTRIPQNDGRKVSNWFVAMNPSFDIKMIPFSVPRGSSFMVLVDLTV